MELSPNLLKEVRHNLKKAQKQVEAYTALLEAHEMVIEPGETEAPQKLSIDTKGIRERIRLALQSHPEGLKPIEIVRLLKAQGINYSAKTPLGRRIHSELYQIKEQGEVTLKGGRYRLTK